MRTMPLHIQSRGSEGTWNVSALAAHYLDHMHIEVGGESRTDTPGLEVFWVYSMVCAILQAIHSVCFLGLQFRHDDPAESSPTDSISSSPGSSSTSGSKGCVRWVDVSSSPFAIIR